MNKIEFVRPDGEAFEIESDYVPRQGEGVTLIWNDDGEKEEYIWYSGIARHPKLWWHPSEEQKIIIELDPYPESEEVGSPTA